MKEWIFKGFFLMSCLTSFAESTPLFTRLNSQIDNLNSGNQKVELKKFLHEVSQWLIGLSSLSSIDRHSLIQTFSKLSTKIHHEDTVNRQIVSQFLEILEDDSIQSSTLIVRLKNFLETRLTNTWLGCRPKAIQNLIQSYASFSDLLKLQTLSTDSLQETELQIHNQFPNSILLGSTGDPSPLSSLPGYESTARYKETMLTLEAVRLAVQFILLKNSTPSYNLSHKRAVFLNKMIQLSTHLNPNTLGFKLISEMIRIGERDTDYPIIDKGITNQYLALAESNLLYASEIFALIKIYESVASGNYALTTIERLKPFLMHSLGTRNSIQ